MPVVQARKKADVESETCSVELIWSFHLTSKENPVSLASHKQPAPHPSLAASLLITKLCWTKLEPLLAVG